jgi:hypothetical protein
VTRAFIPGSGAGAEVSSAGAYRRGTGVGAKRDGLRVRERVFESEVFELYSEADDTFVFTVNQK